VIRRANQQIRREAMPMYLHQWRYGQGEDAARKMLTERQERVDEARASAEAFGGRLHHFFFCLGEYDGLAITEFPSEEHALACLMARCTGGRVASFRSTPLIDPEGILRAKIMARDALGLVPDAPRAG
jgi:uncharacterized protein with GYD domain